MNNEKYQRLRQFGLSAGHGSAWRPKYSEDDGDADRSLFLGKDCFFPRSHLCFGEIAQQFRIFNPTIKLLTGRPGRA